MIYLASMSPRRRTLLKEAGIRFRVVRSTYRESDIGVGAPLVGARKRAAPTRLVQQHALGKALGAARPFKKGIILGADTIVYFKSKIIGKPKNRKEAFQILAALQGHWHKVYTGVAVFNIETGKKIVFYETTRVRIRKMSHLEIQTYFRKINPMDKAGAYAIQSKRNEIVERIEGSFSNAIGLPMERLAGIIAHYD